MTGDGSTAQADSISADRKATRRHIAERLVAARTKLGLTVEDVAGSLRLPPAYVRAFDSGDWQALPEEAYALGFLRQYANLVSLDISDDMARLKSADYRLTRPATTPAPPTTPTRTWAIASAALFVMLFVLFNLMDHDDSAPAPAVTPKAPTVTPKAPAITSTSPAAAPKAPAVMPKTETAPASPPAPTTAAAETANDKTAPLASPAAPMHHYTFLASGEAVWLQVFSPTHALIREALLQPGERLRIDAALPELRLVCGNAAALQISVDGAVVHPSGSLGKPGEVLRDFKLTAPSTQ